MDEPEPTHGYNLSAILLELNGRGFSGQKNSPYRYLVYFYARSFHLKLRETTYWSTVGIRRGKIRINTPKNYTNIDRVNLPNWEAINNLLKQLYKFSSIGAREKKQF